MIHPSPAGPRRAAASAMLLGLAALLVPCLPLGGCGESPPAEDELDDEWEEGGDDEPVDEPVDETMDETDPREGRAAPPSPDGIAARPPAPPPPAAPIPARLVQPAPRPQPPGPPEPADEVAKRIEELHPRGTQEPPAPLPGDSAEKRAETLRARAAWEKDLDALAAAADSYLRSVGDQGGDARTLFRAGQAKAMWADRQGPPEALRGRMDAEEMLARADGAAPADAGWAGDAAWWLGRTRLFLVDAGRASLDDAVASLRDAVRRLGTSGRSADAGRAAVSALAKLVTSGMDAEARAFAEDVGAAQADYGPVTEIVRTWLRRAETGVGARLPSLPVLESGDDREFSWASLAGKPFVLHFFSAGLPTGKPAEQRDVATVLAPLYERLHARGLEMVGVSMDLALEPDRVRQIAANWEEWGVKGRVQDGSRDSVRRWAEDQGLTWPWLWDGRWNRNPVSLELGGAGVSQAHAILVDRDGTIRWRGDAPFEGLSEVADALFR